jgi:hypothetical protein
MKHPPWLSLPSSRQSVIEIAANAQVKQPVASRDLILRIQRKLFHVGMTAVVEQTAATRQVVRR